MTTPTAESLDFTALRALVESNDAGTLAERLPDALPVAQSTALATFAVLHRGADALAVVLDRAPDAAVPQDGVPSPTWLAAATGAAGCLDRLLQVAPDSAGVAANDLSPTTIAAMLGHTDCVVSLGALDASLLEAVDPSHGTPACAAATAGQAEVLAQIAQRCPAALSAADSEGRTPAYLAASHGHLDAIRAIADAAPDTLAHPDPAGLTPTEIAFHNEHWAVLELLLERGQPNPSDKWDCGCAKGEVCT